MIRVAVYEFATSGGLWELGGSGCLEGRDDPAWAPLACEGAAMLTAVARDLAAITNVAVIVPVDARCDGLDLAGCIRWPVRSAEDERRLLAEAASDADWTIVIAPEFDQLLESRCRLVEEAGGRLLGPSLEVVALAADKHRTAEHLAAAGVAVPAGVAIASGEPWPKVVELPLVLKPRFGAGSQDLRRIDYDHQLPTQRANAHWRLERFCPGLAASVAVLCGPAGNTPMAPCLQHQSDDGRFAYLGGRLPLPLPLARRATALAMRAIESLPAARGYLGVDLVLGADPGGRDDVAIEINPRLTTSYVGLRAAARCNLAAAMLDIASGVHRVVSFGDETIEFDADGRVRRAGTAPATGDRDGFRSDCKARCRRFPR